MKRIINELKKASQKHNIQHHNQLEWWCDYMLELFSTDGFLNSEKSIAEHYEKMRVKNEDLFRITFEWMVIIEQNIRKGKNCDVLGTIYEELYLTKNKAGDLGQFFTPTDVCEVIANIFGVNDNPTSTCNDPACGSGRMLIANHMMSESKKHYYIAEDVDPLMCKMCALNMMIHGMLGHVVCHDTLKNPDTFLVKYQINEVRFPLHTPYFSIRRITE